MNYCPSIPSSKKPVGKTSLDSKIEINELRKSLAERERKILCDISNMNARSSIIRSSVKASIKKDNEITIPKETIKEVKKDNLSEIKVDFQIKEKVSIAIADMKEDSTSDKLIEHFGCPDIRITNTEIKKLKGKIWYKHWDKNPLPGNFLPDHFYQSK